MPVNQVSRPNLSAEEHDLQPQMGACDHARNSHLLANIASSITKCGGCAVRHDVLRVRHDVMVRWPCAKHVRPHGVTTCSSKVRKSTRDPALRWQVMATCA